MPVHERAGTRPQPLSLPTPGPCEVCQGDRAEYRFVPCGGPADDPTSHRGKLVYTGSRQVNHDQEERDPPVKERALPSMGQFARGAPTKLARVLLLYVRC